MRPDYSKLSHATIQADTTTLARALIRSYDAPAFSPEVTL